MQKSTSLTLGLLLVVVLIGVFVMFNRSAPRKENSAELASGPTGKSTESTEVTSRTMIGGVERPRTDVRLGTNSGQKAAAPPLRPQGFSPPVVPDENPQVAAVYAALKDRSDPAKFSSFVVPTSFDADAFSNAPLEYATEYAKTVEPGRVYATAQPAIGTVPLRATSSRFHRVKQGESVRLSVESKTAAPVTFTSENLGAFDNKLTSITVVADNAGVASAVFTASGGTVDEVQILAGSPVNSGQVTFIVAVKPN